MFKLGLVLPTRQTVETDFMVSVINLFSYFNRVQVPGYQGQSLALMNRRSAIIPKSRQELVLDAFEQKCSHILFIDDDQIFPPNLPHRLASHGKRVMACNIATKAQGNSIPTARRAPAPGEWWGGHIIPSKGKKGIEKVWRIGFGVILIDLQVFKDEKGELLPFPWFNMEWRGAPVNDFCGEDWFFCELMDKRGIPIWIDHDASLRVGHIGKWIYDLENCAEPQGEEKAA
jgi:hypothetical protein